MNDVKEEFSKELIKLRDIPATCNSIIARLRKEVIEVLRRKGAVVGISGGIDSSVTLALCAKAFGTGNVVGIMLPEKDSSPESAIFAKQLADKLGVKTITENITEALEGFGCYNRRDEAVKRIFPEYSPEKFKMKIGIRNSASQNLPPTFSLVIVDENKQEYAKLLPVQEYLQIVASSNFKQRCRMSMLYYHAERLHYAVIGTPNKHEVDQGFFVKYGDGGADIMPIGKLYKTQVYELASYLEIPGEIINRIPTTDTYTAEQTQEEFFYQMPFEQMDLLWFAFEQDYPVEEVAVVVGMNPVEIGKIFNNFRRKHQTTDYLRKAPIHF